MALETMITILDMWKMVQAIDRTATVIHIQFLHPVAGEGSFLPNVVK